MRGQHQPPGTGGVPRGHDVAEGDLAHRRVLGEGVQGHVPAELGQEAGDVVPGRRVARSVRHPGGQQRPQQRLKIVPADVT